MRNMFKRALSLFMAVVMIVSLGLMGVPAFAEEGKAAALRAVVTTVKSEIPVEAQALIPADGELNAPNEEPAPEAVPAFKYRYAVLLTLNGQPVAPESVKLDGADWAADAEFEAPVKSAVIVYDGLTLTIAPAPESGEAALDVGFVSVSGANLVANGKAAGKASAVLAPGVSGGVITWISAKPELLPVAADGSISCAEKLQSNTEVGLTAVLKGTSGTVYAMAAPSVKLEPVNNRIVGIESTSSRANAKHDAVVTVRFEGNDLNEANCKALVHCSPEVTPVYSDAKLVYTFGKDKTPDGIYVISGGGFSCSVIVDTKVPSATLAVEINTQGSAAGSGKAIARNTGDSEVLIFRVLDKNGVERKFVKVTKQDIEDPYTEPLYDLQEGDTVYLSAFDGPVDEFVNHIDYSAPVYFPVIRETDEIHTVPFYNGTYFFNASNAGSFKLYVDGLRSMPCALHFPNGSADCRTLEIDTAGNYFIGFAAEDEKIPVIAGRNSDASDPGGQPANSGYVVYGDNMYFLQGGSSAAYVKDTTAPVISFAVEGGEVFQNDGDPNIYIYVPTHDDGDAVKTVTITLTASDLYLKGLVDGENVNPDTIGDGWTKVSASDTEAVYQRTVEIASGYYDLLTPVSVAGLKAADWAGNETEAYGASVGGEYTLGDAGTFQVKRLIPPQVTDVPAADDTLYSERVQLNVPFTVVSGDRDLASVAYFISRDGGMYDDSSAWTEVGMAVGSYTVPVEITLAEGETGFEGDHVALYIKVTDAEGNFSVKRAGDYRFDVTLSPRITMVKGEPVNVHDGVEYFNAEREVTAEVEDLHLVLDDDLVDLGKLTIGYASEPGVTFEEPTLSDDKHTASLRFTFAEGKYPYGLEISCTDEAGHSAADGLTSFIVDTTAPAITITAPGTGDEMIYVKPTSPLVVQVEDLNFDPENSTVAIEADVMVDELSEWTLVDADAGVWQKTLQLQDGDVIKSITVNAKDYALNSSAETCAKPFTVDDTPPVVEISVPAVTGDNALTYLGIADENIADGVIIRVTERNFDPKSTTNAVTTVYGEFSGAWTGWTAVEDQEYTWQKVLDLNDADYIRRVTIEVWDLAGNNNSAEWDKAFIVDLTAPVVDLRVKVDESGTDKLKEYMFTTGSNGEKRSYIIFKDPVTNDSALTEPRTVKLIFTLTVVDKNLSLDPADAGRNVAGGAKFKPDADFDTGWTPAAPEKNTDTTLTLEKTVEIDKDSSNEFQMDFTVHDLAGNVAARFDGRLKCENASGNEINQYIQIGEEGDNGHFEKTIIIDRRRPSTNDPDTDTGMPEIALQSSAKPSGKTTAGVDLFNKAFDFTATVYDDYALSDVRWWVLGGDGRLSKGGFVKAKANTVNKVSDRQWTIPGMIEINGEDEENIVSLIVTVTDEAGNTISFARDFAVDNRKPVVQISFDNYNVANGKYYRDERTATITVEDLNFDPVNTPIYTEGNAQPQGHDWTYNSAGGFYLSTNAWSRSGEVYTARVKFSDSNGKDFHLRLAATDRAKNYSGASVDPFVIDLKDPTLDVVFDNNDFINGKYFNAGRVASITIVETNFGHGEGVVYEGSAMLDGEAIILPPINGFSLGGDVHTGSISFMEDGDYHFTISYTDLSGRTAVGSFDSDDFTIDMTPPEVYFDDAVEDHSANRGAVEPSLTLEDINFDFDNYSVVVTKIVDLSNETEIELPAQIETLEKGHGYVYHFEDLADIIENDGIYSITAMAVDLAGNESETVNLTYSVNRKGSTYYAADDATKDLLNKVYSKDAPTLKIAEINPDGLVEYSVTKLVNRNSETLVEGRDYSVSRSGGEGFFNQYVYTINSSAFMKDGNLVEGDYTMVFNSKDMAGNLNSNRDNERNIPVEFVLDITKPILSRTGIDNGERVKAESANVTVMYQDNTAIAKVEIFLNDRLYKTIEGEELVKYSDEYAFDIAQQNHRQSMSVYAVDAAGNEARMDPISFTISTNALVLFVNNPALITGAAVVVLGGGGLGFFLAGKKKKKKEEETETKA